jgi:uncharacterized protein YjbI with pentapeptide repeats/rhodanese-related sulfurtransferase
VLAIVNYFLQRGCLRNSVTALLGGGLALTLAVAPVRAQGLMDSVDMTSADMTEAEITAPEVASLIAGAESGSPPDLTSRRLSGLDLSGLDFKGADLRWARLNKTKLRGANLRNCKLDLGWLVGADLEGADLTGASLFSAQLQGANLKQAKLDGARITANLSNADLRGASLRDADMAADMKNQSMGLMRAVLTSAMLDGADLSGAHAARADMEFASLRGARLDRVDLTRAKLGGADLTEASVAGTVFRQADVAGTNMTRLKNRELALGMDALVNSDRAVVDWEISADPDPGGPEKAPLEDEFFAAQQLITEVMGRVDKISSEELKKLVDANADFVLLDVRTPDETRAARIDAPQHLAISRGWLEMKILNHVIDKQTPIVTYCGVGIRSAFAAETLMEMGFSNVRNYEEGLSTWEAKGYPVAR